MLLAFFIFSGVDAMAKHLTLSFHPLQVVWFRQLGLLAAVLGLLASQGWRILATDHLRLQLTRGALAAASGAAFIAGISFVPLADAVAVSFVAPFMVTVLAALALREPVGRHRWTAVAIGFAGTLIVIRPGLGVFHPAMFLVMIAATFFALRQIVSRALSSSDRTITTVAYTALVSSAILTLPMPFVWTSPETGRQILLLVVIAVLAGLGEFILIKALEIGQAAAMAPTQYTLMIWGTFYGWLIFDQLPDGWTWLGAAIIMASGIYTVHRERIAARQRRTLQQGGTQ